MTRTICLSARRGSCLPVEHQSLERGDLGAELGELALQLRLVGGGGWPLQLADGPLLLAQLRLQRAQRVGQLADRAVQTGLQLGQPVGGGAPPRSRQPRQHVRLAEAQWSARDAAHDTTISGCSNVVGPPLLGNGMVHAEITAYRSRP